MADIKDLQGLSLNPDFLKNIIPVNPMQDILAQSQHEQEKLLRSIQQTREEKEAEELRRHTELVGAIKSAAENGATIVIGDNANNIQVQQNSVGTSQQIANTQELDYTKVLAVLHEIREYFELPQFHATYQDNSENIKALIQETISAVEKKEDQGIIKKSLRALKDMTIGAGGSLIASGILALLGSLPII